jgi:aldehyde:ferredoxin oxidoreductase
MGDLLRIDLTSRTVTEETVPPELIQERIGAKGVGTRYLSQEVGPDADPLGPDNKLILTTGPLSGTKMFGGNRYAAYFVSPATNAYCEAYSGGNLTPQFARTGYKVVILEGAADSPVYLEISESGAAIHPADHLWGMDAFEAEDAIRGSVESPKARACAIGPAGENQVVFACINNDYWHHLGRGGGGAVMGSKKVKGIVFHGTKPVEVARPDEFQACIKEIAADAKDNPGVAAYKKMGTAMMVRILNGANAFPTRYWQAGTHPDFEKIAIERYLEKYWVRNESCPPCLLQCVKHNVIKEGPLAGLELEGPEYETIYVFGGLCELIDPEQIMRMNDICDRLGIDTMSGGNLAALAIECCRRGILDLGLDYGDADGVAEFLGMMARREGVGDLFAKGILTVEKELGLEGIAVHTKGLEPAGYDPRSLKGMGLGYLTSPRGACHLRATFYKAELAGFIDPAVTEGKAEMLIDWEDRLCIMDTLVYCRFYRDLMQWPRLLKVVNSAIGTEFGLEELRAIGASIIDEARAFNEARGVMTARSERLPAIITGNPTDDEKKMTVTQDEMDSMMRDYYRLRGWGTPTFDRA